MNCKISGKFLSFLFILITLFACKKEASLDPHLWIGSNRGLDQNKPYPYLLEKKDDTLFLINYKNEVIDQSTDTFSSYTAGKLVQMKNHQFGVIRGEPELLLFDIQDTIYFPYNNPALSAEFQRVKETDLPEIASIQKTLMGRTWRTESQMSYTPNRDFKIYRDLNFKEEQLQTTLLYFYKDDLIYSETEYRSFNLFERGGKLFFTDTEDDLKPQTLYQITAFSSSSFTLEYFKNSQRVVEKFQAGSNQEIPPDASFYSRCLAGQPGEYYHDNLTYLNGNQFLINKIGKGAPAATGNGYITVHFILNCKGAAGRLGLEQMDDKYKTASFPAPLIKHVVTEVMELKEWPEIKRGHGYKDVHSFLMFKITNGKITDLCP